MSMGTEPVVELLRELFVEGFARVPAGWRLSGPETAGYWWQADDWAVATPLLLRLAQKLPSLNEAVGLLLVTENRYREPWLRLQAARLRDLGSRGDEAGLCSAIDELGDAAESIRQHLSEAMLEPTPYSEIELAIFDAPADQPSAAPGLRRVLGLSAPFCGTKDGSRQAALPGIDPKDPRPNWIPGRLLQAPAAKPGEPNSFVLSGGYDLPALSRMAWVLGTPWATLLGQLVFMAEAWKSERQGGLALELPPEHIEQHATPQCVQVVVTLSDGQEVFCGTLGELCLRALEAMSMVLVPVQTGADLDIKLAGVVARLLKERVWAYEAVTRPQYVIGEQFSLDCYRGEGHRYIYLAGEHLTETLRSVCVSWARSLAADQNARGAV